MKGKADPGADPDDLARYANEVTWRESLLLLFELLADRTDWLEILSQFLFGENFEQIPGPGEAGINRALLLAAISVDPYSGLTKSQRMNAWRTCWTWEIQAQKRGVHYQVVAEVLTNTEEGYLREVWRVFEELLEEAQPFRLVLADCKGLEAQTLRKMACLSNLRFLDLSWTSVSDLSPLSDLMNLDHLHLEGTLVSDVSPLSGLVNLSFLNLSGTPVSDVSPLASLVNLRFLDVTRTFVSDVSSLSHLTKLSLERSITLVPPHSPPAETAPHSTPDTPTAC
jgi:hypothetical protein